VLEVPDEATVANATDSAANKKANASTIAADQQLKPSVSNTGKSRRNARPNRITNVPNARPHGSADFPAIAADSDSNRIARRRPDLPTNK
jgi:hypothetical protein